MYNKKEYAKQYWKRNKEKLLATNKAWCAANRKRRREYDKQLRRKDPERFKMLSRCRYAKRKDDPKFKAKLHASYIRRMAKVKAYHAARYLRLKAQQHGVPINVYAKRLAAKKAVMALNAHLTSAQKKQELSARRIAERLQRRIEVLSHYSSGTPKCACCGETVLSFLTIDHVNQDGSVHRKTVGKNMYHWLYKQRQNYPTGFQVLCYNCNCARSKPENKGVCPHQH